MFYQILCTAIFTLFFSTMMCGQSQTPKAAAINMHIYDTQDPVLLEGTTTYVISVRNEGTAPCVDLYLKNISPESCLFVKSSSPFTTSDGNSITFFHPKLNPGETIDYKIEVKMTKSGSLKNTCILKYNKSEDTFTVEESTYVVSASAVHSSQYDTEDPIWVGSDTIYAITVRNEGTDILKQVNIQSTLSPLTKFVAASGASDFKIENNKIIFLPVPIINPGQQLDYKITVRAQEEGVAKATTIVECENHVKVISEESTTILSK